MKIVIIAAVANNNVIGYKGKIPWQSVEDLKFFKNTTKNFPVIMGRKTFQSIGSLLSSRINIILSRSDFYYDGAFVFNDFESAIDYCSSKGFAKVFIIGGADIYQQSIALADELIISRFSFEAKGDVYFPDIDENIWIVSNKIAFNNFSVYYYSRK